MTKRTIERETRRLPCVERIHLVPQDLDRWGRGAEDSDLLLRSDAGMIWGHDEIGFAS